MIDENEIAELYIRKRYDVSERTQKCWLGLKDKIPLSLVFDIMAIWHYKNKSNKKDVITDVEYFLRNFSEFSFQGSFTTKLPKKYSQDLLYVTGLIMGDGSLALKYSGNGGRHYEIYIEKANYPFIRNIVKPLFIKLFQLKDIKIIRENNNLNKIRYRVYFKSRIIFELFTELLDVPVGKKSHIIRFPKILNRLYLHEELAFFAGLVDTDWGSIRWNRFGTHMSSRGLRDDYKLLFQKLGIDLSTKRYVQKERFISYQCYMNKGDEIRLFNLFKEHYSLKNTKRIKTINAGMGERLIRLP